MIAQGIYNLACFHAHQAVEKTLKAALAERGKTPPRTHSLTDLTQQVCAAWALDGSGLETASELDDFYIPTRYPDALPGSLPDGLPVASDAREARDLAGVVVDQITALLAAGQRNP